jgi:hypothetical protein
MGGRRHLALPEENIGRMQIGFWSTAVERNFRALKAT